LFVTIQECKLKQAVYLTPSRYLLQFVVVVHIVVGCAVIASPLMFIWQLLLLVAVFIHGVYGVLSWGRTPTMQLHLLYDQWWLSTVVDARVQPLYEVVRCCYWQPWFAVIVVRDGFGRNRYLPLLPDNCNAAEFHRLQLLLTFSL